MRKLIVSMNVTLDGFLSGQDCELDWHFKRWTAEMGDELCRQLAEADTILLGRVTYCAMANYWPLKAQDPVYRGEDFAFANMMNTYAKLVFSRTLKCSGWNNSTLVKSNFIKSIKALKKQPGKNIIVYGSGKLVAALTASGFVDEYQLWLHPDIIGSGKALFHSQNKRSEMKLFRSQIFSSGVVLLHYQILKQKA